MQTFTLTTFNVHIRQNRKKEEKEQNGVLFFFMVILKRCVPAKVYKTISNNQHPTHIFIASCSAFYSFVPFKVFFFFFPSSHYMSCWHKKNNFFCFSFSFKRKRFLCRSFLHYISIRQCVSRTRNQRKSEQQQKKINVNCLLVSTISNMVSH